MMEKSSMLVVFLHLFSTLITVDAYNGALHDLRFDGGKHTSTSLFASNSVEGNTNINTNANSKLSEGVGQRGTNRRAFLIDAAKSPIIVNSAVAASVITTPKTANAAIAASPLKLPALGLGAWAWGDSLFWKYDKKQDGELREVFEYASTNAPGGAFLDTAELYGLGRSETLIHQFRDGSGTLTDNGIQVATKFAALPWRTKPKDVVDACRASLKRLNGGSDISRPIDLYQIHFPNAYCNAEYWDGLAECYEKGLVRAVGVSNYGSDALRAAHAALKERGIPLATNQIQLSLLYRWPLENGLMETCKELGVEVLSYSPLALGFLTGKYTESKLPEGPRASIGKTLFKPTEDGSTPAFTKLLDAMGQVAKTHDASLSQVALNWARAKGSIPIPGARNLRQVKQNYDALAWSLSPEEMGLLDTVAANVPSYISPDASPFPKKDKDTGLIMFDS